MFSRRGRSKTYTEPVSTVEWFELAGFGVGLLSGSFLNVCIARIPRGESVVRPGSRCLSCGKPVRWFDNVPVLSWLALRGRCRECKAGISWRYPTVEMGVAVWFALAGFRLWAALYASGNVATGSATTQATEAIALAALGFLLIGLMVMDWQTHRLPDAFTFTGIGMGFVLTCVRAFFLAPGQGDVVLNTTRQLRMSSPGSFQAQGNVFMTGSEAMVLGRVGAICGAALLLLLVRWGYKALRGQDGMGLGDVKMLAMIAAFLGFWQTIVALFAGVMAACVYAVAMLALRRANRQTKLPFGSFLAAGGLFAAAWGAGIVGWYAGLLR